MGRTPQGGLAGLFGRPYLDLEPYVDAGCLPEVHDEVCLALCQTPLGYTGGSHRSMGIMPPTRQGEALVDYAEVIRELGPADYDAFRSLADDPSTLDATRRDGVEFGEERDLPLSRRQMLWLKVRFGVYFPWKAYLELIPNSTWGDKANPVGKSFTRVAQAFLPRTIRFIKSLPFQHIGRCNVMGLEAFDHGTVHRDGDPAEQRAPDQFITFTPAANKRLFLWDDSSKQEVDVSARVCWFNDFDYHGVRADPFFRYSIRVDGVFLPEFEARLERDFASAS